MFLYILLTALVGNIHTAYFPADSDYNSCYGDTEQTCEDGWTLLIRPQGGWCIKYYIATITRANAETACKTENATLSGIQYPSEITTIVNLYTAVNTVTSGSRVWIGAYRTPACLTSFLTTTCNATNSFYWTDNFTTGTAGFVWTTGNPNNNDSLNRRAPVVSLVIIDAGLDDVPDITTGNKGYICGKQAT